MSTLASMHIMHTPTYSTTTLHSSSTLRARSMQIMHITYAYSSSTVPEELFSRASMHTTLVVYNTLVVLLATIYIFQGNFGCVIMRLHLRLSALGGAVDEQTDGQSSYSSSTPY